VIVSGPAQSTAHADSGAQVRRAPLRGHQPGRSGHLGRAEGQEQGQGRSHRGGPLSDRFLVVRTSRQWKPLAIWSKKQVHVVRPRRDLTAADGATAAAKRPPAASCSSRPSVTTVVCLNRFRKANLRGGVDAVLISIDSRLRSSGSKTLTGKYSPILQYALLRGASTSEREPPTLLY
jgi:hypothetical protein